ncbi:UNVERIFIED_CONTAM: amidase [Kocuria sp. CPCC 205295]|uniref:amidase family protein n=1 Tax=Kocuria sp. CPCC 205295 TaxID=3073557 RepID=UPI0036D9D090
MEQGNASSTDPTPGPSAREDAVTQARRARSRVLECEDELRAWVRLSQTWEEQALAIDGSADRLPLRAVCVGVKDLIDVAGMPTRAGSSITSADPVGQDAACVARLRELGAVILGKTVTTEFGYFSPGPTRNPQALEHTPGGSSSGSAAAVGAGTVPLALGTQTAGSLTRPASYCGTAGMVLAHGSTDLRGITGLSESLDSLGLLTPSVAALRRVLRAFGGLPEQEPAPVAHALIWDGACLEQIEPPMAALIRELPDLLQRAGCRTAPLDWDDHVQTLAEDHSVVMAFEAHRTRQQELELHGSSLSPQLRELLERGRGIPSDAAGAALARRDRSREELAHHLGGDSVVVGPAAPGPAPAGLEATGSPALSRPWQLLGLPVVVVPGARTVAGLPLGAQLIGLPGQEEQLLELGEMLEPLLRALDPLPDSPAPVRKEMTC